MQKYATGGDSQFQNVVTTRQASYSYVCFDSNDRGTGQPLNNFTLSQGKIIAAGYPTRIVPVSLQFPWSIPNVNIMNNTISITNGTTIYTATIAEDFYTNAEFAVVLASALNSLSYPGGGTFSVSINPKTFYYTVSLTASQTFAFINTPGKSKDLLQMSGFSLNTTQALTQVGAYNNLQYTTYFDIRSNSLTQFQKITDTSSDSISDHIVMRVYINGGYGAGRTSATDLNTKEWWCRPGSVFYEPINPKYMIYIPEGQFISNTDFYVSDDNGNSLYFPTGSPPWQINFLISET